ncbi:hypothetical protein DH2020_048574 [Rehmannia glutinosa]|uniref:Protein kinase domain-containing protein n=1 Tax=Rehmannia glutinosa TaxID=99300 RepID=A0ABR0U5Q2_REHGL
MGIKFILSAILVYSTLCLLVIAEPVEDKQALLDFIDKIYHSRKLNWNENSSACNSWTGITCNHDNSRVVAIRLPAVGFRGEIPPNTLSRLSAADLEFEIQWSWCFHGPLPLDFSVLSLANNDLSGDIPDINIPSLQSLDLSNNNLTGSVPRSLLRFPSSSFSGNNISSEDSLLPASPPTPAPIRHSSKFSESAILAIVIGSCVIALAFFEGCSLAFDLEDLLRASAEVLGKGTFGTTYKAALEDATTVAVKRLREVVVGRKEFEQQMEIVGNIRHENVAPLRAYYYSKDEKLMVYDYYSRGSVSALLHAKRGEKRIPLDWETRLKIAIGAARGVAHIHTQSGGKLIHGNIKSSNIFLNSQQHACLSDLGLATLTNPIAPPVMRIPGYRAPEVTDTRKVSQPSDVYSFGVLLLELLTGKSPVASGGEEVVHLVRWVHSVVREEWTGEVFDVELLRYPNIEEEMVAMLQIGMSCVARVPAQRPKIGDVVRLLEDVRSVNTGNNSQSGGTRSPGSTPSLTPHVVEIGSSSVRH